MLLFAMRWFGGGDAKLYAAIALWFDLSGGVVLIFSVGMAGLLLAVTYLAARRIGPFRSDPEERKNRRIPYGVAIGFGAVIAAYFVGWGKLFPGMAGLLG